MPRRKYARLGEKSIKDECCNKKCRWQGMEEEKVEKKRTETITDFVCPNCGNNEFYPLLYYPDDGK